MGVLGDVGQEVAPPTNHRGQAPEHPVSRRVSVAVTRSCLDEGRRTRDRVDLAPGDVVLAQKSDPSNSVKRAPPPKSFTSCQSRYLVLGLHPYFSVLRFQRTFTPRKPLLQLTI